MASSTYSEGNLRLEAISHGEGLAGAAPYVPAYVPTQQSVSHLDEIELYGRMQRAVKAREAKQEITFEFTRDPALLQQYYNLREQMYIRVWGLKHFAASEDALDKRSHILVARKGKYVIGGARITTRPPGSAKLLPMEKNGEVDLQALLPELHLSECKYAEFSRLAVDREYLGGALSRLIYQQLNRKSIALRIKHVFAIAPVVQARNYKKTYNAMGLNYKILTNVNVPDREEYEGIRMCLSMLDLSAFAADTATTLEPEEVGEFLDA